MKHRDTKTGKKLTDSVMCGTISSYWYCSNSNILRIWVLEGEKSEVGTLKQIFFKKQEKRHITYKTQLFIAFKKHFKDKDKNGLKLKEGKIYHANTSQNDSRYSKNRQSRL